MGLDSTGFEAGSKQHGTQCFISALVLALSIWTIHARTRLVTPRHIWTGSCRELQAGRQHLPSAPLTSQGCPHCAQSKTKTSALIYKCLSETWVTKYTASILEEQVSRVALRELHSIGRRICLLCTMAYSYQKSNNNNKFHCKNRFFFYKIRSRKASQQLIHKNKTKKRSDSQMRINDTANCSVQMPDIGI